jgi:uncharacterized membrane protein YheB (UPF0754 family)
MNNSEFQAYLNDLIQSEQITNDQRNFISRTMTNPEGRTITSIRAKLLTPELSDAMTKYSNYLFNQETIDKQKGVFKNSLNPDGSINKDTVTYYKWKRTIDPLARQNAGLQVTPPDAEDALQDMFITITDYNRQIKNVDARVDNLNIKNDEKELIKKTFIKSLSNDFAKYYETTTGEKTLDALKRDLFVAMTTTASTDEEFAALFSNANQGEFTKWVENQLSVLDSQEFIDANEILGITTSARKELTDEELLTIQAFKLNATSGNLNKTQIKNQMKNILESFADSPNFSEIEKRIGDIVTNR